MSRIGAHFQMQTPTADLAAHPQVSAEAASIGG
jgi:hypothetical protein